MGILTGCLGGLMRDVVCNEVPLVLKQGEIYVTCALAGAAVAVMMGLLGATAAVSLVACGIATFGLRAGSIAFGWKLPVYRARPPGTKGDPGSGDRHPDSYPPSPVAPLKLAGSIPVEGPSRGVSRSVPIHSR